jgi:phosphate transport system substrate-binding protein
MKKTLLITIVLGLYAGILLRPAAFSQNKPEGQITLSGAFALYPMAVKWAEEFKKINPGVRIDISAGGAGKGMTDVLNNMVEIGMVSREIYPEEIRKGAFPIAVTRDAVVPVISAQNPVLNEVLKKGLKKETGNNIWITGKFRTWSSAFGANSKVSMHVYTRSDACGAAEVWAKYFGKKQEDLLGSGVYGDPGLALAVKKDPLGIGFNNIGYAYDFNTKKQIAGIRVVPLDLNNDGVIDQGENFYDSMDELVNAIATGKYPSPPSRELYFVTSGKPKGEVLNAFIKWVLSDGQKFVRDTGYINLSAERLSQENLKVK